MSEYASSLSRLGLIRRTTSNRLREKVLGLISYRAMLLVGEPCQFREVEVVDEQRYAPQHAITMAPNLRLRTLQKPSEIGLPGHFFQIPPPQARTP
jgi:hypothetical protein